MFFDIIFCVRFNQDILDKIKKTTIENPDREFESSGHFVRSAVMYYCKYLDDLKYKEKLENIKRKKEVKKNE